MQVVDSGRHEGTHPLRPRYFVVDAGDNSIREKGQ